MSARKKPAAGEIVFRGWVVFRPDGTVDTNVDGYPLVHATRHWARLGAKEGEKYDGIRRCICRVLFVGKIEGRG